RQVLTPLPHFLVASWQTFWGPDHHILPGLRRPVLGLFSDRRMIFGLLLNLPAGFRGHVAKLPPLILYLLPTILGEAPVQVITLPDAILLLLGRLLPLLELFTYRRSFFRRQAQPFI